MKKTRKMLAVMMALLMPLALGLTACGNSGEGSDDGQNPVMNFVGNYVCDRANIFFDADGEDGASAVVTWGGSASENSTWVMSGTFDAETLQFEYHDCVRTDYVYKEDGSVESETEVYVNGHGFMTFSEGDPLTLTWQDDQENVADGMVFEYSGMGPETGMTNPWSVADSAEAAAEGAGIDGFTVPEDVEISLGKVSVTEYRYMDGMAEAYVMFPAVDMTIRKGSPELEASEGDISGDYNEYANEWTEYIGGMEVKCFGNREGEATKTIWSDGTYDYSITAYGMGGDTDYGLSSDDLEALINGIQ